MKDNLCLYAKQEQLNYLKKRFDENIKAFEKYLPDIGHELKKYSLKDKMHFCFGKNGIPNLVFENKELFFKCDDPVFFCRQQVDFLIKGRPSSRKYSIGICCKGKFQDKFLSQAINKVGFEKIDYPSVNERNFVSSAIIFGIGLGYQISELLKSVEVYNLVLIEPNKDIFYASLYCFDWNNLLTYYSENKLGLKIILGDDNVSTKVYDYMVLHGKFLASNTLYYVHYKNKQIERIRDEVLKKLNYLTSALGFVDDIFYGISHACWSILNRKSFVNRSKLRNEYKDLPVFVVASGPSLDKDISFLRKYQDKAIIIACGTALDVLYHAGIRPDFFANTERVPEISQSLDIIPDEDFFSNIILLSSDVCHPLTVNKFKKTALFGKADEPTYKIIIENFPEYKSIQYVSCMNPLVGNMGIAGALYLGFRKLYLFGLDCGNVLKNNRIHSSFSSLYNQHGYSDEIEMYKTEFKVEGNFGQSCYTNALFQFSLRKIEEVLDLFKKDETKVECFNCSDGCKIDNATPICSEELCPKFEAIDNINKDEFIDNFLKEKTSLINLSENDLLGLFNQKQISSLCNEIISFISKKRNSRIDYIKMMEDISEHLSYLSTTKEYFLTVNCINSTLQHIFIVMTQALYLYPNEEDAVDVAKEIADVVIDYLTELPEIYSHLPFYIMGREKEFYTNGMVGRDLPHCKAIQFSDTPVLVRNSYDDPQKTFKKRYE